MSVYVTLWVLVIITYLIQATLKDLEKPIKYIDFVESFVCDSSPVIPEWVLNANQYEKQHITIHLHCLY